MVLRAHKEAVNSLGGSGSTKLGTVATVVAAANSTAVESAKEIEAAMRISMRAALGVWTNRTAESGQLDDLTVMKVYIISIFIFFIPLLMKLEPLEILIRSLLHEHCSLNITTNVLN